MEVYDLIRFNDVVTVDKFQLGNRQATALIKNFEHGLPHVHIYVDGEETVFDIRTGNKIVGKLSGSDLTIVRNWILTHRRKISRNWNKYSGGRIIENKRYSKRRKHLRSMKGKIKDVINIMIIVKKVMSAIGVLNERKFSRMF